MQSSGISWHIQMESHVTEWPRLSELSLGGAYDRKADAERKIGKCSALERLPFYFFSDDRHVCFQTGL